MAMTAAAAPIEWMTNLETAGQRAKEEQKLLLVEFTGSDWCKACLMQKEKVLETPEFEDWVEQHCVAVKIDVPNNASRVGGEQQKALNRLLCDEYGVVSFPTLLIMTPELVEVGGYRGAQSSPTNAIAHLEKSFSTAQRLEQALTKTGAERTAALCPFYQSPAGKPLHISYPLLKRLVETDPHDSMGLHTEFRNRHQIRQLERDIITAGGYEARLRCAESVLAAAEPANVPYLRKRKGQLMRELALHIARHAQSAQELARARKILEDSIEYVDSEHEKNQLRHFINTFFARPTVFLRK